MSTVLSYSSIKNKLHSSWKKHRTKKWLGKTITYLFVIMLVIAILAPFVWMVISSISPQVELSAKPPHWFPENPTLSRYRALIFGSSSGAAVPAATAKFLKGMRNSLVVSVITTVICVVTGTMAAYALARLPVLGKNNFMIGTLSAQMTPVIVIVIPLYLLLQQFDMIDTQRGLILLYTGFMLPTVIWVMHSYFLTIPQSLEEAALIDGCNHVTALIKVVLPLSGPGLVAVSAFTFLSSWNEFFMALIFTSSQAKTITVVVTEFSSQFGVDFGLMATGGVIGSLPPLILAFLFQRYIVEGLTAGALKGE
ncbi:MAG TPA: ABC transporter permease [Anaerolineaceae bacterium]|nr:ABC transporter permease [Anaerolineaceae bacterium]